MLTSASGFRVQGSGFRVQGSGLWWRLRRDPSTQVAAVLAFVISHTTFLAAQDDETGRCLKAAFKLQVTSHSAPLIPNHSSLATHPCFQTSGFARGACRPLIACKRESASSTGSEGSEGWCGAFRHPERRKTSCVKKWLI